jgi:ATP-binding cassette subfamily F protein uup
MTLLQLQAAELAYVHVPLLHEVSFVLQEGERVCLLGRNGSGKSTLLGVLEGRIRLDAGEVWRRSGLRIAALAQEVPQGLDVTVFEVVASGLGKAYELWQLLQIPAESAGQQQRMAAQASQLHGEADLLDAWSVPRRVESRLQWLGLDGAKRMSESSGGVRRRALLGRALVSEPDVLLLDEPTNHLDIASIRALEESVASFSGAVVFITHDRAFVDRLATRIIELDRGVLRSYPGNHAEYLLRKSRELEAEAAGQRRFDDVLAEEEVWIRQGIKARRTRNEGRVRRLEAMRRERAQRIERLGRVRMRVAEADQSGKRVFALENVVCGMDGSAVLAPFSIEVQRGDRIGIIGANGSGKTTLIRTLIGEIPAMAGEVLRGSRVEIAYFDQERQALDPEKSVRDNVADGADHVAVEGQKRHVAGYLADFLFNSARIHSPVKSLSGGERNRLLLARLFARPANVLILDEPTNDLDLETLELLEERIGEFAGTLFLVSHDRRFLDRTVTSLLTIEDGTVNEFPGGYSEWQKFIEDKAGSAAKPDPAARGGNKTLAHQTSTTTTSSKKKLSYREKSELAALPARIEILETRQAELQQQAAAPEFYRRAQEDVATALKELERVSVELDAAYSRWVELEG